jgi:hypothetical protein
MAQWLGQFSGHTHETKVEDAEALLRHAIEVFRAEGSHPDYEKKAKALRRLAQRLLTARLKLVKAQLAAATDVQSGVALAQRAKQIAGLERKYEAMRQKDVVAILREFGLPDVPLVRGRFVGRFDGRSREIDRSRHDLVNDPPFALDSVEWRASPFAARAG